MNTAQKWVVFIEPLLKLRTLEPTRVGKLLALRWRFEGTTPFQIRFRARGGIVPVEQAELRWTEKPEAGMLILSLPQERRLPHWFAADHFAPCREWISDSHGGSLEFVLSRDVPAGELRLASGRVGSDCFVHTVVIENQALHVPPSP